MNKDFQRVKKILSREFGKNRKMYLATVVEDVPTVRIVPTYYWNKGFYLVTHESSETLQQIAKNKKVSLCATASFHTFQGEAFNMGHPLKKENKAIRDKLTEVFSAKYFENNDESDPKMCFVRVEVNTAFTYGNKIGYTVDFRTNEIKCSRFAPNG